jgi:phage terminase large subunit
MASSSIIDPFAADDEYADLPDEQREFATKTRAYMRDWKDNPVHFVCEAIGAQPDPWQCDVLDTLMIEDNVALRACHGVGKTAVLSWFVLWFLLTKKDAIIPTTSLTYNKQVRDVLWGTGIARWFQEAQNNVPWLTQNFDLLTTRLAHKTAPGRWYAVGIAPTAIKMEGYHSENLAAVVDEAKGIQRATWDALQGMRTTDRPKFFVASTPGSKTDEFFKICTQYRETWKALFVIHPAFLRPTLHRPEAKPYSHGGTYYSERVRAEWGRERALEWGENSGVYQRRVIGDFSDLDTNILIPTDWLHAAASRMEGIDGEIWISCDVARSGRDRTVIFAGRGGTVFAAETVAKDLDDTTAVEAKIVGVGKDPKRPFFRSTVVTAEICMRMRREHNAVGIIVDNTGLGTGVCDYLEAKNENVVRIDFGGAPSDRAKDAEARRSKTEKSRIDSHYANVKAEMGQNLRNAFEAGDVALGLLSPEVREPLIEQASLMEYEFDVHGRMRLIDPDDQEEVAGTGEEVKRSPDHFHSLLLLWWRTGYRGRKSPRSGALNVPSTLTQLGMAEPQIYNGYTNRIGQRPGVGGQAAWVATRYR